MEEKYFKSKSFVCSNNENLTIVFELFKDNTFPPALSKEYKTIELIKRNGEDFIRIPMLNHFELVIHAIVDNEVYVTVYGPKDKVVERYTLGKDNSFITSKLVLNSKEVGFYMMLIKEYGRKLKKGLHIMYNDKIPNS